MKHLATVLLSILCTTTCINAQGNCNANAIAEQQRMISTRMYRLPTTIRPVRYDIHLTTFLQSDVTPMRPNEFRIEGRVQIKIDVLQYTQFVYINQAALTLRNGVDSVKLWQNEANKY